MMAEYRSLRDMDWALLLISLAICATGVLQIFSATHDIPPGRMRGGNRLSG